MVDPGFIPLNFYELRFVPP